MDMIQGAAIMRFDFSYRGCLLMALLGPREMSDLSPQSETKADIDQIAVTDSRFYEYAPFSKSR